ncbi:4'-phosphopantetheinyl transferase [Streptomyces sp. WMMB 714]|uniref:4'-phosphopantetheinyl transferase family protein n=1 Tax=Streptomyces sp. WMMB 714 TaxID=1286822 RepID=UPI0005F81197|nr:4'-phosphopantetheinyl transferase superfamily protein [Streptomyces sp. WMMB 714]SCK31575.1 4'-phosphopantetheinyl transferase [Streptomyces sp. WMMB 714]
MGDPPTDARGDAAADGAPLPHGADTGEPPPVRLWFCACGDLPATVAEELAGHWLDEHERGVASRFVFGRDRRRYLVAHALLRRALSLETGLPEGELAFRRSPRGRPALRLPRGGPLRGGREPDFSLTHSGDWNLLGTVPRGRIGVDVESLDRGERGIRTVERVFSAEERDWVAAGTPGRPRDHRVLRLWTLKEAYAKARGLGLALPFDSFSFTLAPDGGVTGFRPPADDSAGRWRFLEFEPAPDVVAAVAVRSDATPEPFAELRCGFPWSRAAPRVLVLPRTAEADQGPRTAP